MVIINLLKKPLQDLLMKFDSGDAGILHDAPATLEECSVVLLVCIRQSTDLNAIEKLLPQAKLHFKKAVVLALYTGVAKPPLSSDQVPVFSLNDFTFLGHPNKRLTELFSNLNADILISMNRCNSGMHKQFVRQMPASLKAGIYHPVFSNLFHFMLELDDQKYPSSSILDHFVHYLKNIKLNVHE